MEEQQQEVAAKRVRTVERPREQCPRCDSEDTKFCYFNNNTPTQPRYFCRTCERYWTVGGKLRNILYGGGTRRRRQSNKSSIPSSSDAVDSMINGSGGGGMESPSVDVMGLGMTHPIAMSPPVYYGQDLDTGSTIMQPPFDPQLRFGLNFLPTEPQQPFFPLNPTLIAAPQAMQQLDWLHGFTSTPAAGSDAVEPTWSEFLNDEEVLAVDLHGLLGHQPSPPPPFI